MGTCDCNDYNDQASQGDQELQMETEFDRLMEMYNGWHVFVYALGTFVILFTVIGFELNL